MSDKLTKEQSNNTEKPQSKYILPEKMKSLEDVITRIHSEADFISTAFGVHTNKIMDFFYMKDLISLVEHYVTNKYLSQEINCSYEHKYTLQNIANFINALGSHKVPIVIQDKNKLCGCCTAKIEVTALAQYGIR